MTATTRDGFIAARVANPFGQFGQANDQAAFNGTTACGPTCDQSIIKAFKHVLPTINQVCAKMPYYRPRGFVGTSAEQNAKALSAYRLPYKAQYGLSFSQVRSLTAKGPVMIVVQYRSYPNWKNYHGATRPTPWAKPYQKAGANQFPKPVLRHWVVFAGVMASGPYKGLCAVFEPNHNSPARPENVAIDYVSTASLSVAYKAAGSRIAVIPTRTLA